MTSQSPRTLPEAEGEPREVIFISHAAPEDNAFRIWLGAKLAAMSYEVWADVLKLKGGDDWQRKLENALRHRACKLLLVANPWAVDKQGVRNEIQIASEVARKLGDAAFIIPLRMEPFEALFLIAHAQYIDFTCGWAHGLSELLETLQETYRVPRNAGGEEKIWREIQLIHGKTLVAEPERLISNWLSIDQLPRKIRYYEFKGQVSERRAQARICGSRAGAPGVSLRPAQSYARIAATLRLRALTYGPPRCKRQLDDGLSSLHKRIRHVGALATAKMEIRAS